MEEVLEDGDAVDDLVVDDSGGDADRGYEDTMTLTRMMLMTTTMMTSLQDDDDGGGAHRCNEKMSGTKLPVDLLQPINYRVSVFSYRCSCSVILALLW